MNSEIKTEEIESICLNSLEINNDKSSSINIKANDNINTSVASSSDETDIVVDDEEENEKDSNESNISTAAAVSESNNLSEVSVIATMEVSSLEQPVEECNNHEIKETVNESSSEEKVLSNVKIRPLNECLNSAKAEDETRETSKNEKDHLPLVQFSTTEKSIACESGKLVTQTKSLSQKKTKPCFPCTQCKLEFDKKKLLNKHLIDDHGRPEILFKCPKCEMEFEKRSLLSKHVHGKHGVAEPRPHKCDMCDKAFKTAFTLKEHRKIHTGEKPFACTVCKKKFIQSSGLKDHLRIHTGEKPFPCKFCPEHFGHRTGLVLHTRRKHTMERPYLCDLCPKRFSAAGSLTCHMRRHNGEKKFICDQCPSRFVDSGSLKRHKKTHSEKSFSCDLCEAAFFQKSSLKIHFNRKHAPNKELQHSGIALQQNLSSQAQQ